MGIIDAHVHLGEGHHLQLTLDELLGLDERITTSPRLPAPRT